jgi:sucrose-6-phosphate hydrolase SacC (GH32 family)
MSIKSSGLLSDQSPKEPYRPKYHFSAEKNWLNDPNGMVYYQGEYHLFYQYHPDSMVWGPMHWGHAVSRDLLKWEHLPIALYPDQLGTIFSGSAVIDYENTAGFGPEAMVALFTHHNPETEAQSQSLAYSLDNGRTWTKYPGNPIIETPPGMDNFRDPKVFWYGEVGSGHWVMCLAAGLAVQFYTSPDLLHWQMSGRFGDGYGATSGVWETPELFKLPVKNSGSTHWVLTCGILAGGPDGGTGTQYFVGTFNGRTFNSNYEKETELWADYGADFYAAQSWNDTPGGRRIWLAWMNNWQYARQIPTTKWRGLMTIPRELSLIETADGPRLSQQPIPELKKLRGRQETRQHFNVEPDNPYSPTINGSTLEIIVEFEVPDSSKVECFGLCLRGNIVVGYEPGSQRLFIDRTNSGQVDFHNAFPTLQSTKLGLENGRLTLRIFLDQCSVELFASGGTVCFTNLIFPDPDNLRLELFSQGGSVTVRNFVVYEL